MDRRDAIKQTALLTGFALSTSVVAGILQGCQPEPRPVSEPWQPRFFNQEEGALLADIGELILPRTDTPGAKDVGAHEMVDQIAHVCMDEEEQQRFRTGWDQLLADYEQARGQAFDTASAEEQLAYLNEVDQAARDHTEANPDLEDEEKPFFLDLKSLILFSYFSSEKVGTEVTAYLPIPGGYEGCMPYEAGTPAWTL